MKTEAVEPATSRNSLLYLLPVHSVALCFAACTFLLVAQLSVPIGPVFQFNPENGLLSANRSTGVKTYSPGKGAVIDAGAAVLSLAFSGLSVILVNLVLVFITLSVLYNLAARVYAARTKRKADTPIALYAGLGTLAAFVAAIVYPFFPRLLGHATGASSCHIIWLRLYLALLLLPVASFTYPAKAAKETELGYGSSQTEWIGRGLMAILVISILVAWTSAALRDESLFAGQDFDTREHSLRGLAWGTTFAVIALGWLSRAAWIKLTGHFDK